MGLKIYSIIQNILIGIALLLLLTFISMSIIFKIKPCVIISGSMEPHIPVGSLSFIDCKEKHPDIGDVVSYQMNEIPVTHRVIAKKGGGYITKGDANEVKDFGIISQDRIIGTYIFNIPKVGYAVEYMKSARGIAVVSTAVIVFILLGKILEISSIKLS